MDVNIERVRSNGLWKVKIGNTHMQPKCFDGYFTNLRAAQEAAGFYDQTKKPEL